MADRSMYAPREAWLIDTVQMLLRNHGPLTTVELYDRLSGMSEWMTYGFNSETGDITGTLSIVRWAAQCAGAKESWCL